MPLFIFSAQVKILAVDDERSVLNSLRRIFVEADCVFVSAGSGAEGIEVMQLGSTFDVIISDFRMPGMNGIDFLTLSSKLQPQTLRILLTGHAPEKEIETSLKTGIVTTFIPKPWDNDQLLELVENWVACKTSWGCKP